MTLLLPFVSGPALACLLQGQSSLQEPSPPSNQFCRGLSIQLSAALWFASHTRLQHSAIVCCTEPISAPGPTLLGNPAFPIPSLSKQPKQAGTNRCSGFFFSLFTLQKLPESRMLAKKIPNPCSQHQEHVLLHLREESAQEQPGAD